MYLIRLAFAASAVVAATVGLEARMARRAGWAFIRGGEGVREPLFPPEMRPTTPRRPASATYSPYQPFLRASLPPVLLVALSSSLSSSRMKIVFISHLSRAQVNITSECTHLPLQAMTSELDDAEKSTLSSLRYSRRVLNLTALQIFLHSQIFERGNNKLNR